MADHEKRLQRFNERQALIAKGLPVPKYGLPIPKRKPKPKKEPDFPLIYLLVYYEELRQANPVGFTVQPLSFTEILAYMTLYKVPYDAFDIETIRRLDVVWLKCLPKHDPKDKS
jgi:hypothetical protein